MVMRSREISGRAAIVFLIATLLAWLALDHGATASGRRHAVNDALKRGAIRPVADRPRSHAIAWQRSSSHAHGVHSVVDGTGKS